MRLSCAAIRVAASEQGGLAQLEPIVAAIEATGGLELYRLSWRGMRAERALAELQTLPGSPYKDGLMALARFSVDHTT